MSKEKIQISKWSDGDISGGKRANIEESRWLSDWFVGYGKDESCQFEGTWWDMICFAKNILASKNTEMCCPEYYHPEFKNDNYTGEEKPYVFNKREVNNGSQNTKGI